MGSLNGRGVQSTQGPGIVYLEYVPAKPGKVDSLLQEVYINSVFDWSLTLEFARVECLSKLVSDFSKITFAQI